MKFQGPVGLGGMNDERMNSKRNTGPKVECAHLMWWSVTAAEIIKKRQGKREDERMLFILPGEVIQAEWHESFSLDEIYKFKTPMAKIFPHWMIIWNSFFLQQSKENCSCKLHKWKQTLIAG